MLFFLKLVSRDGDTYRMIKMSVTRSFRLSFELQQKEEKISAMEADMQEKHDTIAGEETLRLANRLL